MLFAVAVLLAMVVVSLAGVLWFLAGVLLADDLESFFYELLHLIFVELTVQVLLTG